MVLGGKSLTAVVTETGRTSDGDKMKTLSSSSDERVFAVVSTLKCPRPAAAPPSATLPSVEDDAVDTRPAGHDVESTPRSKVDCLID